MWLAVDDHLRRIHVERLQHRLVSSAPDRPRPIANVLLEPPATILAVVDVADACRSPRSLRISSSA